MAIAVETLLVQYLNKKRFNYGDYDVDGTCSVSIYMIFKTSPSTQIVFFVPNRLKHSYGLNDYGINIIEQKVNLIITVDCGIKSYQHIAQLKQHHMTPLFATIICPPTHYLLQLLFKPQTKRCLYPFKELAVAALHLN